jgi:hypothetical protein
MDILSKADYVRVTEVLSMFNDFSMVNPEVLEKAKERGTEVHKQCDDVMLTYNWKQDSLYAGYIESFAKWAKGKTFPYADKKIPRFYDDELLITGEIDGIYETSQGLVLIDIKTSASPSKTWALQTSAYAYMCKKHGYDIQRIEVLKLDKEGKMPKVYIYQENMDLFRKVLDVYRYFKQKGVDDK